MIFKFFVLKTLGWKTLELRSARAAIATAAGLSFRSLSKLHLHCLQRCRAQFLEADAKAPKPTQNCFFYYTRRRRLFSFFSFSFSLVFDLQLDAVVSIASFFTVNTQQQQKQKQGQQHDPHKLSF